MHTSLRHSVCLIQLCSILFAGRALVATGDSSVFSASAVAAAMLRWALCSSLLTVGLTENCQKILNTLPNLSASTKAQKLSQNRLFLILLNSSEHVQLGFNVALLTEQWRDTARLIGWLRMFYARKSNSLTMLRRLQPLLLAIGLQAQGPQVTRWTWKLLKEAVSKDNSFAFPVLCVLLHKLSGEADPHLLLEFLKLLPQMSVDKVKLYFTCITIFCKHYNINYQLPSI